MRPTCVPFARQTVSLLALAVGLLAAGCGVDAPTAPAPTPTAEAAPVATPAPALAAIPVPTRPATTAPARADYLLAIVRGYADTMLTHGRDVDGPARSPLFSTTLDRRALRLLDSVPPLAGERLEDRAVNAANPMHDENLYQVLYALTEITGERRYAAAADDALRWFFTHTQSPETGLVAWGEHLGWDLKAGLPRAYRDLPGRMRASAARNDLTILKIVRSISYDRSGFVRAVNTETLKPGDDQRAEGDSLFTSPWASTYGDETDAQVGMLCLARFRQTGDATFRSLFLVVADRYLATGPNLAAGVYPGPVGEAIGLEVAAFRLTGERKYLERAEHFARLARDRFFAGSPLPAASARSDHYEALTRGDTLVMALLDLWYAIQRPSQSPPLVYTDR
jgi:hypothetical protein